MSTTPEEEQGVLGLQVSLAAIANYIKEGRAKKIILCCGAGISVSAGIPDFRSKGTGLYDNLQKYDLDKPEDLFSIEHFRQVCLSLYIYIYIYYIYIYYIYI